MPRSKILEEVADTFAVSIIGTQMPRSCFCAQALAAAAVLMSAVNIGGGFTVTKRMLDMFRRPGDPDEHHRLYAIPAAALVGGCLAGQLAGELLWR